jgi:hypothetical protein
LGGRLATVLADSGRRAKDQQIEYAGPADSGFASAGEYGAANSGCRNGEVHELAELREEIIGDQKHMEAITKNEPQNTGRPAADGTGTPGMPVVTGRPTFQAELDALRVREKAHTREGHAIAAGRRRRQLEPPPGREMEDTLIRARVPCCLGNPLLPAITFPFRGAGRHPAGTGSGDGLARPGRGWSGRPLPRGPAESIQHQLHAFFRSLPADRFPALASVGQHIWADNRDQRFTASLDIMLDGLRAAWRRGRQPGR